MAAEEMVKLLYQVIYSKGQVPRRMLHRPSMHEHEKAKGIHDRSSQTPAKPEASSRYNTSPGLTSNSNVQSQKQIIQRDTPPHAAHPIRRSRS
jgi:hypothetical protein